jgi:hypothetical protein
MPAKVVVHDDTSTWTNAGGHGRGLFFVWLRVDVMRLSNERKQRSSLHTGGSHGAASKILLTFAELECCSTHM